jgi:AcrR family transcriptional regulator
VYIDGMVDPQTESQARQRILNTARKLFYRNGYRATGINEIIRKSGVAKATFYAHFPSKESLAYAYVESMNREETRAMEESLEKFPGPYEKLIGLIEFLIPWSRERDYRGCAYLNICSEITDHANPVRQESKDHYVAVRRLIGRLMQELKKAGGASWRNRDTEQAADDYMLIFSGALAMAQVYHNPEPIREAIKAIKRLLR